MRIARAIHVTLMICGIAALAIWLLTRDDARSVVPTAEVERRRDVAPAALEPAANPTREAVTAQDGHIPAGVLELLRDREARGSMPTRDIEIALVSAIDGGSAGFDLSFDVSRPATAVELPTGHTIFGGPIHGDAQSPVTTFGVSPGRIQVAIFVKQAMVGERTIDVDAGDQPLRIEMTVNAVGPIAGHVVDADGAPVPNPHFRIRVVGAGGEARESSFPLTTDAPRGFQIPVVAKGAESLLPATTDPRGGFLIPVLATPPGATIAFCAEHPAYEAGDFVPIVSADRAVARTLTLRLGAHLCEVTGRVVDPAMKTERDLIVHMRSTTAPKIDLTEHTAADGSFRVLGVRPGEYALAVERRCVTHIGTSNTFVTASAQTLDVGDVVAALPTLPLRVRALSEAGEPVTDGELVVDGIVRASLGNDGRAATVVCADDACEVLVVARGHFGTIRAGRLSPDGTEHVLVAHFGGIVLNLRDRAAPERLFPLPTARFVARSGDREIRGTSILADGELLIEQPDLKGHWTIELDVDGFTPCTVEVDMDTSHPDSNKPHEVWMLRKGN